METLRVRLPRPTFWRCALLAVLLVGALSTLLRFGGGLGSSTALSDEFPWGLWIGFDVLCGVALAAGGFTISAAVYVFHLERFRPIVRPAILTAFLGYLLVIAGLMFDLGRPWCIWHAMVLWNPHSVMFEVAWCVMLYSTVLALEFSPTLLERLGWKRPLQVVKAVMAPLVIVGVLLSMLHQSSLGSLYLIMPLKMHALWYTPILPVLFFVSAVCLGCAMTIFESYLSHRAFGRRLELDILSDLGKVILVGLVVYASMRGVDLWWRGALGLAVEATYPGRLFLAEAILGTLAPIALLALPKVRRDRLGLFVASSLVVLGFVLNRLNVSVTSFEGTTGAAYVPTFTEVSVTLMLVGIGFLLFALAARYLPVFPAEERPAERALPLADVLERPAWNLRTAVTAVWTGLLALTVLLTVDGLRNRHAPARAAEPGGQASVTPTYPEKVVFRFQEGSPGPVEFRHASHVKPATSCTECHGAFSPHFEGPAAAEVAADQDFHDETLCGKCHVGEDVFAISQDTCGRCHEKEEGAASAE